MCINVVVRPACQNLPTSHHLTTVVTLLQNEFLRVITRLLSKYRPSGLKTAVLLNLNRQGKCPHLRVNLHETFQRLRGRVLPHLLPHEAVVFQAQVEEDLWEDLWAEEVVEVAGAVDKL
jgi:hypothetical protein